MHYLSKMDLNPRRRQAGAFLSNPHMLHAAVMSCFSPAAHARMRDERVLWRLDESGDVLRLWMVSSEIPSFEHLQEQAGWATQVSWETREYDQLLDRLTRGQRYAFRLAANPVFSQRKPNGKVQRLAHITAGQQLEWLLQRQELMGINLMVSLGEGEEKVPNVQVSGRKILRFPRNQTRVTLARAQFDGELEVTNPDALRAVLLGGVGKAKGYGMGLLTLASRPRQAEAQSR